MDPDHPTAWYKNIASVAWGTPKPLSVGSQIAFTAPFLSRLDVSAGDPDGEFHVVWFEGPDIQKTFTELATSSDEFTVWFQGQAKTVTGVDLSAPPESPPPDLLVDSTS